MLNIFKISEIWIVRGAVDMLLDNFNNVQSRQGNCNNIPVIVEQTLLFTNQGID